MRRWRNWCSQMFLLKASIRPATKKIQAHAASAKYICWSWWQHQYIWFWLSVTMPSYRWYSRWYLSGLDNWISHNSTLYYLFFSFLLSLCLQLLSPSICRQKQKSVRSFRKQMDADAQNKIVFYRATSPKCDVVYSILKVIMRVCVQKRALI